MEATTKPADSPESTSKHRPDLGQSHASGSVKKAIFNVEKMAEDAEHVYQHVRDGGKLDELRETKSV